MPDDCYKCLKPGEVRRLMREAFKAGFAISAEGFNNEVTVNFFESQKKGVIQSEAIRYVNKIAREYRGK